MIFRYYLKTFTLEDSLKRTIFMPTLYLLTLYWHRSVLRSVVPSHSKIIPLSLNLITEWVLGHCKVGSKFDHNLTSIDNNNCFHRN